MLSAEALHTRGVEAINAGRIPVARRRLLAALERCTEEALTGSIEASLAYVEAETGRRDEAMELCQRALARTGLSAETLGSIHGQLALLHMLAGRDAEAMEGFDAAIATLPESSVFRARALVNRGNLHLQHNVLTRAAEDFAEGRDHLRGAGLHVEAAMAEHNLGYVRFLAGDLARALQDMDSARPVIAPLSPVAEATCEQDRAEVLMAAGLVDQGRTALRAAARAYGVRRLRRRQAEAELALARAEVIAAPADAVADARAAVRHFRTADAPALASRAEAVALAAMVNQGQHGRRLLDRTAELESELRGQGARWEATAVCLHGVRARLARGELAEAGDLLARTRIGREAPLAVRLLDREVRAEHAAARGRRTEALSYLRQGLADLHAWQSSFGSLDLQTMVVGHGKRLGVRALRLAVESPRPDVLFEWSERARMLASRVQAVRAPQDPQTAADLAELRAGPSPAREAELRQRVRELAWRRQGSGVVADPVTLAELQAGLDADTALVAYVATADRLVALVVTDRGATRCELGTRAALDGLIGGLVPDLDIAATSLPPAMQAVVRRELATRLDGLAGLLVAPLSAAVGDRRMVLTPSGVLAGVPWPLLPGLTGRPVEVARSATSWLSRRTTPRPSAGPLTRAGFVAGPRVCRAQAEVTAASDLWPEATVLTGDRAVAAAVSEMAGSVDVLHVAVHGRHSADNPLFSGIELVDGPWYGYDIDRLPAVPQVVLLSACELGRSTVRHGEELIGMATAWLHAGARWVLAATAAVDDEVAHDTLVAVHAGLRQGRDPAAALAAVRPCANGVPAPFVCFS